MKIIFTITFVFCFLFNIDVSGQIRYANRVTAWSSQYSPGSYSAAQAAGAPNTLGCGDASTAWCPTTPDGGREFLELEYDNPVPINRVFVHENAGTGAVDTIYVMNPVTQEWVKVFETTAQSAPECPRTLIAVFPMTGFPVSKLRIAMNSPAVASWNEIDAVGIAAFSSGGAIGADQTTCPTVRPAAFTNIDLAFDGAAGVVYQWEDSTVNGSWQPVNGANASTYHAPATPQDTWFRRSAVLNSVTVYSNAVKVTIIQTGDPAVFPVNQWNFYTYQANNINLDNANYLGYYSRTPLNFSTEQDWNYNRAPGAATVGYQGCDATVNNFVIAARRKGFPAGNYILNFPSFYSAIRIYLDGTLLQNIPCCLGSLSVGALDENSELEIRLLGAGGQTYLNVNFQVAALSGGDIGESQALCTGNAPANFISNKDAFGGAAPATITYQWQDSVVNGNWTNIANATGKTFQSGALTTTTWFRRKASDNTGAVAYSDIIKMTVGVVQGDTSVYGNNSWRVYAYNGNDITLSTNTYRGYYTATGLTITTPNDFPGNSSPSSVANYDGCPVDDDNFVISAKRQGFPEGIYNLNVFAADDWLVVLVDGIQVHAGAETGHIRLGYLNANSKVELRLRETTGAAILDARFTLVFATVSEFTDNFCKPYYLQSVNQNGWHDFIDGAGNIILSVHPNGNDLGRTELMVKHFGTTVSHIPTSTVNKKKYLPRNFKLYSGKYPSGNFPNPVLLRLYYRNSEFENYKIATNDPSLTLSQLQLAHYKGLSEDCEFSNNADGGVSLASPTVGTMGPEGFYLEASTNSFSEFSVLAGSPTLPVTLTSFLARVVNTEVHLNWATSQELNNKGFEVLRSEDGRNFNKIGWVEGNNNSHSTIKYSFTDASPLAGKSFYRLRQVDLDGNFSYSGIVAVSTANITTLSLGPNPVSNMLYIGYDVKNTSQLAILDLQGRVLWKQQGQGTSSLLSVPVQQFEKGVYLLEVTDRQGKRQTQKFVKQ